MRETKRSSLKIKPLWLNRWTVGAAAVLLFVALPIVTILFKLFADGPGEHWAYLSSTLLSAYFINTLILILGVGIFTFVLGVGSAWLVSNYSFWGRKQLEWLLILSLAFPSYILAYTYVGVFEYTGPLSTFLRNTFDIHFKGPIIDIMNMEGTIFIMSISLFPYVYVLARSSFLRQSRDMQEASLLLGASHWNTFWKVALPMARPAVAGGLALVAMEALNDYGTVKYFGVNTFTVGIFRAWFSMGDMSTAIRLAGIMSVFVLALIWIENFNRGNKNWSKSNAQNKPVIRTELKGFYTYLVPIVLGLVFLVSFLFPVLQLFYWVAQTWHKVVNIEFFKLIGSSFTLAVVSSLLIAILAIILLYAMRLRPMNSIKYINRLASLGYSIPGAVVAVGVMIPVIGLDKYIMRILYDSKGLFISSTLFMLVYAYIVRYMAVGYNAIESGFQKTGAHVNEVSRLLGAGNEKTLWKVDLPLIKKSIASAVLLTFVDLLKELPLTLILRPYNFNTLATQAFDLATNEMVEYAANSSLIIVLTGIIPVILLNRIIRSDG